MSIALQPEVPHYDITRDAVGFESDSYITFNYESSTRKLELRLLQTEIDQTDNPINAHIPLIILLIDTFGTKTFEDAYLFTRNGHPLAHQWRTFDHTTGKYDEDFFQDTDMKKLQRYSPQIREMLDDYRFRPAIERNPIIKKLREGIFTS